MKKVLFSIFICFLISGCSKYNELSDYIISTALAIDYQDNKYTVSLLAYDKDQNSIYPGTGKSVPEALQNLSLNAPKEIYNGHLSVVILSEQVAKRGLNNPLKYFMTQKKFSQDFYIILEKKSKASHLLKIDEAPQYLIQKIKTTNNINSVISDYTNISKQLADHNNLTLNSFKVKNKNNIVLDSIGYFKQDKMIGWANKTESTGLNIVNNKLKQMNISIKCPKGYSNIDIRSIKTIVKINKKKIIKIIINGDSYLQYTNCNLKDNKHLQKQINKKISKYVNSSIKLTKKQNIDLFNIGNLYYQNYHNYYNRNEWNNNYKNLKFQTKVKIKLKSTSSNQIVERINNEKNN